MELVVTVSVPSNTDAVDEAAKNCNLYVVPSAPLIVPATAVVPLAELAYVRAGTAIPLFPPLSAIPNAPLAKIELYWMESSLAPVTYTPLPVLKAMMLGAADVPVVFWLEASVTPLAPLARAWLPDTSAPILFPSIVLPVDPEKMRMPLSVLPEITLPSPLMVEPIVLLSEFSMRMPLAELGRLRVPVGSVPRKSRRSYLRRHFPE